MKFTINRTSLYSDDEIAPIAGAKREPTLRTDLRTCPDKEFDAKGLGGKKTWRDEGLNHRTVSCEDAKIARDFPSEEWVIEVNTLEELLALTKEHGEIIVWPEGHAAKGMASVEIYDTYRE